MIMQLIYYGGGLSLTMLTTPVIKSNLKRKHGSILIKSILNMRHNSFFGTIIHIFIKTVIGVLSIIFGCCMKYFGFKELLNNIFNGPLAFLVKFILMFCGYGKKAGGPDILDGLETPSTCENVSTSLIEESPISMPVESERVKQLSNLLNDFYEATKEEEEFLRGCDATRRSYQGPSRPGKSKTEDTLHPNVEHKMIKPFISVK